VTRAQRSGPIAPRAHPNCNRNSRKEKQKKQSVAKISRNPHKKDRSKGLLEALSGLSHQIFSATVIHRWELWDVT
jgi:hypothetical protein